MTTSLRRLLAFCLAAGPLARASYSLDEIQSMLPPCSILCLAGEVMAHGCALDDWLCHCHKIEPIIRSVSPCLVKAGCNLQNLTATGKAIYEICTMVPENKTATTPGGPETPSPSVPAKGGAGQAAVLTTGWWMGVVAAVALLMSCL